MAQRELDILVRAKGALQAAKDIGKVDGATGKLGKSAKIAGAAIGAGVGVAAVVIGRSVKSGLDSLAQLENAESQVTGALAQVGLAGQVTASQVSTWANKIESDVGAAFDDKDITSATATLLRFGKVTPSNLQPAMVVMTDLAAKTGSVDSAATLLAKALADPTKAAGKLARAGVILTAEQQKQIKALVKAGDAAGAQKVLLDALAQTTKGAAAASQGPYARSLAVLQDVTEDAQRALAEGFLPVIEEVRDLLSKELAKPETLNNIREFGKGLAGGLKGLIDIARGLPWGSIGDALKIGGMGAKAVLDAFSSMPPWVQTAVATGWGLNKLTGGLVTSLASGLIKGVLGMNAGVVNIKAGIVNGGGLGGAGAAGGGMGLLGGLLGLGAVAGVEVLAATALGEWLRTQVTGSSAPITSDHVVTEVGPIQIGLFRTQAQTIKEGNKETQQKLEKLAEGEQAGHSEQVRDMATQKRAIDSARDKMEASRIAIRSAQTTAQNDAGRIVDAIDRIQFPSSLSVTVWDKGDPGSRSTSTVRMQPNGPSGVSGPGHGA